MNRTRTFAVGLALVMVLSVLAPLGTVAAESDEGGDSDGLSIAVEQDDGVVVTVTSNGSAVPNATVDVTTVDENESYAGTGTNATDENGTVALPTPEENVTVEISAEDGNATASTTVTLEAAGDDEAGDDEADDSDENAGPFGALVSQFVQSLDRTDSQVGHAVASFVLANNPGNAPDHAGPPGDDDDDKRGPPGHANASNDGDDKRGPPSHAGPSKADDDEADDDEADDDDGAGDEDETEDDGDGGDEEEDGDDGTGGDETEDETADN